LFPPRVLVPRVLVPRVLVPRVLVPTSATGNPRFDASANPHSWARGGAQHYGVNQQNMSAPTPCRRATGTKHTPPGTGVHGQCPYEADSLCCTDSHTGDGQNYAPPDPYEKTGFRGMGVLKPYKLIWFRDTHATKPYFFIGFRWCVIVSTARARTARARTNQCNW
jgi:hypothetical protein